MLKILFVSRSEDSSVCCAGERGPLGGLVSERGAETGAVPGAGKRSTGGLLSRIIIAHSAMWVPLSGHATKGSSSLRHLRWPALCCVLLFLVQSKDGSEVLLMKFLLLTRKKSNRRRHDFHPSALFVQKQLADVWE